MSTHREIPGFYFDVEKGKYFRIQPNHKAPAGAAHSQSAVNAKERADRAAKNARIRHNRDIRSVQRIDPGSFTNLSLDLRLGARPRRNLSNLQKAYAAGLCCQAAIPPEGSHLGSIAISSTGSLYATIVPRSTAPTYLELIETCQPSITFSPGQRVYVPLGTHAKSHNQLAVFDDCFASTSGHILTIGPTSSALADVAMVRFDAPHVMDMTAFPTSRSLAIAGQRGDDDYRLWFIKDVSRPDMCSLRSPNQEQMVVAFKDENIIMSGQRNGIVNFTDHRAPSTIARLKHSSGVTGISQTQSSNHILVSGMPSVAMYDLRTIHAVDKPLPTIQPKASRRRIKSRTPASAPTRPVISFFVPEEKHTDFYFAGKSLAYIADHNIAVVVSHTSRNLTAAPRSSITLYDCSNGCMLPSPLTKIDYSPVMGLATGRVRDGPQSIFVSTSKCVQEWSVETGARNLRWEGTLLNKDPFPLNPQSGMISLWNAGDHGTG